MKLDSLSELFELAELAARRRERGRDMDPLAMLRYLDSKDRKKKDDEKKKKEEYKGPSLGQLTTFFVVFNIPISVVTGIILLKGLLYLQELATQLHPMVK